MPALVGALSLTPFSAAAIGFEGTPALAYVRCTGCGAMGPTVCNTVFEPADCDRMKEQAAARWANRA